MREGMDTRALQSLAAPTPRSVNLDPTVAVLSYLPCRTGDFPGHQFTTPSDIFNNGTLAFVIIQSTLNSIHGKLKSHAIRIVADCHYSTTMLIQLFP